MFHIVQAAHDEATAIRGALRALALRVANAEAVAVADVRGLIARAEALWGHTSAAVAAAHPANTPEAGMDSVQHAPAAGTDEPHDAHDSLTPGADKTDTAGTVDNPNADAS